MKSYRLFSILLASSAISSAQTLYTEGFDSEETANVVVQKTSDAVVQFVDYGDFTLGDETFNLVEAPNKLDGSAPTRGVFFQANLTAGEPNGANLIAAVSAGGDLLEVSGTYRLSFDCFINVADPIPGGGTEQVVWGIGTGNDALVYRRGDRANTDLQGVWGWLSGESGYSTEDSVVFAGSTELERKADGDSADLWNEAFVTMGGVNNIPARTWATVTVDVFSDVARVSYNGVLFHEVPITEADAVGVPRFGYEDPFGSISDAPDFQWAIIDNVRVETVVEPALAVSALAPFEVVTAPGGQASASFQLENKREGTVTLTEATLSGDGMEFFQVKTPLPLAIAPGETATFEVDFIPGGQGGVQEAELVLLTDDPDTPPTPIALQAARFGELLAHFKLDDEANPPADASGNNATGVYQQFRFDVGFGETSLHSGGGTSVSFTDDHASGTGNWAQFDVLHTPSVSLALWIKPEEGIGNNVIFNRTNTESFVDNDGIYGMMIEADGTLSVRVRDEAILFTDPDTIVPGESYHVAFTHRDDDGFDNESAARSRLYVNGEMVAEAVGTATFGFGDYPEDAAATDLHLGSRIAAGSGYAGSFDDLQVYRVELEPRQVQQLVDEPGTTARFDDPNLFVSATGDFGTLDSGDPVSQVLTITNSGETETLTISRSELSGLDVDHFTIATLPTSLAPGESVDVMVTFDPMGSLGGFSAQLEFDSNDETDATVTVPLTARVPNPSGLLVHYKLDDAEGTTLEDASGNGRDGIVRTSGGGQILFGQEALATGSAVRLEGGDESVVALIEVPASASLPVLDNYTVSMWFELDPADEETGSVLFAQGNELATSAALALLVSPSEGPLQWIVNQDQGEPTLGDLVKSGTAYHLAVTHIDSEPGDESADSLNFYINGVLVETIENPVSIISEANTPFLFGGVPGASGMIGTLDDLQLYEKALTGDDIAMLFAEPGTAIGAPDEPVDPVDPMPIEDVSLVFGANGPTLSWDGTGDTPFVVEFSQDLETWTILDGAVSGNTLEHSDAPADAGFYRVARGEP